MEERMVEFIRVLRAAGVRISLAESQDAMFGAQLVGVFDQDHFRSVLKSTLVKEARDQHHFDYFYPLYFASNKPPMQNIPDNLTPDERNMLQQALQSLSGFMDAFQELLKQMMDGQHFSDEQLGDIGDKIGLARGDEIYQRDWFERRMNQQAGMKQLQKMMDELLQQLEEMGMSDESLEQLREMMDENSAGLSEQLSNYVGMNVAKQMAQQDTKPKVDLLDIPFSRLERREIDQIRDETRRLAARLRSRASLRQKRAKSGNPDLRRTMRANMRYGGIPMELKQRTRHVKPSLVVICDVSTSMRYCTEFLLTLIYELQDQVKRTNSYIFIDDLTDISMAFNEYEPHEAVNRVLLENRPGYYNTDLGNSLDTFKQEHMSLITGKTTTIILGDGRNNYNSPRLDIIKDMQRKGRRLIWFCPEHRGKWGTGDSDMLEYAPLADSVHYVNTLRDLANAVDTILADG
jgi:uncharacterized protein